MKIASKIYTQEVSYMDRFTWKVTPKAPEENCVAIGDCRITVLTPNLLRLEQVPNERFADLASQMAFHRDFPKCDFTYRVADGLLTLETEALRLTWRVGSPFAEDTLCVKLLCEPASSWRFGEDFEDLGGTASTLDEVDGACPVDRGVCSRNGFSVLDDSDSMLLLEDGDVAVRPAGSIDCYFFGYGFDYIRAVQDLYRLTGIPPMLPAFALGNWWSRYYAYEQQEYLDLMDRFQEENVPFSVGVVDMDWHITEIPEDLKVEGDKHLRSGWTGYTWNKDLFPDYKQFLKDVHSRNLKTALNLHPASGVCPHEDMYPQMAKACGIDPDTKQRVPFNVLSQEFMEKYFDILHHPYENDGVDFWWMDWQQGTDYWWIHEPNKPGEYADPREKMTPLWLLNHLHILDISRNGKRPMFFSRYSGPGSHRYPVGFSGDASSTWESLKFQPEFTAMASNVGYSWWSHDIGGHNYGVRDEEMYLRWVQLGVFSPINRLHSTHDPYLRKEPWCYGPEVREHASRFLRLRHKLFPYLYTMNYRNHAELLPLVQPMYYTYPKNSGAYEVPTQFWFGSELMVSPIVQKADSRSQMAYADVWLPKGYWFDFFTGLCYASKKGRKIKAYREYDKMPVFAKTGAIVPMANYPDHDNRLTNCEDMTVLVFPGASNRFTMYEDSGDGSDYAKGAYATTDMQLLWSEKPVFTIQAAQGDLSLIPQRRTWRIGLRGFRKDAVAVASCNGEKQPCRTKWEQETNTLWLTVEAAVSDTISVEISGDQLLCDNSDVPERIAHIMLYAHCTSYEKRRMMERINDSARTLQSKYNFLISFMMQGSVGGAIMELLCLKANHHTGTCYPDSELPD